MKNDLFKGTKKYGIFIKSLIIEVAVTLIFILLFSILMYLTEKGYEYASVFATVSVALGSLAAAFSAAKSIGKKGLLTGAVVGGISFILVTLISLFADNGGLTVNTVFHFIIIMLSSLIGAVLGVNRKSNRNYI